MRLRSLILIVVVICLEACTTTQSKDLPDYIFRFKWPEVRSNIPENASLMKLSAELPPEEFALPIEIGDTSTVAGIVVSEAKAWRLAQYKIELDQLRALVQADRLEWVPQREAYELQIKKDALRIEELYPTWWDDNKFWVGLGLGVLGVVGFVIWVEARD